jgi:iron-regulated transporter 1
MAQPGNSSPTNSVQVSNFFSYIPFRLIYLSHFLSTFNSRVFEFSAVLFLAELLPGSLLPVSIYALVRSLAAILLSARVGRYVDSANRLSVVRASILGGRAAVVLSCLGFLSLGLLSVGAGSYLILAALCVPACVEKLCSIANLVSVEKDWVIVLAGGSEEDLQRLNAQMRRIDLFCKIFGPLIISALDTWNIQGAILMLIGVNSLSLPLEYLSIAKVYNSTEALQAPRSRTSYTPLLGNEPSPGESSLQDEAEDLELLKPSIISALRIYSASRAFIPSLALAMLYFTVLSFSGQLITYLFSTGLSPLKVTLLRTVSVLVEITATFLAPRAIRLVGPVRAALWFISFQALVLLAGSSFWATSPASISVWILVGGVILSRIGRWGFDLAVQFLIQTEVSDAHRGSFGSTEAGVQNVFELLAYALTIVFRDPKAFQWPVYVSVANVAIAAGIYAAFVRRRRGHLLHVHVCCEKK